MNPLELGMVVFAGLFAGGAATFAWSRVPIWRRMPTAQFVADFAQTLSWTDKVQPALLLGAVATSLAYATTTGGMAATVALAGTIAFIATLVGSLLILVPLQRTIIATPATEIDAIEAMRRRWFAGNLGRSVLSVIAFSAIALAAAL